VAGGTINPTGASYKDIILLALQLEVSMHRDDLQLVQMHDTTARLNSHDQMLIAAHSQSMWPIPGISRINENPDRTRLSNLISALSDATVH
jgi:hypothetical protein